VEHFFKVRLLGVLVLPAAIVLVLAYVETRVVADSSPPARAKGVVWAGRTFVDRAQFARWLRSRGVRYRVWAQRHPALAGITPKKVPRTAGRGGVNEAGDRWRRISPTLIAAAAALSVLLLILVFRGRRLVRWLGRVLSAFPRPSPRGVAFRGGGGPDRPALRPPSGGPHRRPSGSSVEKLGGAVGAAAVLRPGLVLRAVRRQHRAKGPPAARRRHAAPVSAAANGGRFVVRTGAAAPLLLFARARSAAFMLRRRRGQLAWYLATGLLAAGTGLLVTAWLNGA